MKKIVFSGHADIASASYEARRFGVRNGMWMKQAKELCKELVSVPYDFAECNFFLLENFSKFEFKFIFSFLFLYIKTKK